MLEIYVDGDACPVKDEVLRVAERHGMVVHLVSNRWLRRADNPLVRQVVVAAGLDAADDWIAERARGGDVVVTGDLPLAARCPENGARVLVTDGRPFTEESIGGALASRALSTELRERGVGGGGPRPLSEKDRSRFASRLDQFVQAGLRESAS